MNSLKVLLVDDHILFRKGVASLLASRPNLTVIGEAGDGCEAMEKVRLLKPDIILMDVHMPRCNGPSAVREIKNEFPDVKIIMLTVDEQDEMLFESIKSGAQGYTLKKVEPEVLFSMIDTTMRGEAALSPMMMSKILAEYQHTASGKEAEQAKVSQEMLTQREIEVLKHIVSGDTNSEIAEALNITENTVKKHLRSILSKLHLQNRIQVAVYAVQEGLLKDPPPHLGN